MKKQIYIEQSVVMTIIILFSSTVSPWVLSSELESWCLGFAMGASTVWNDSFEWKWNKGRRVTVPGVRANDNNVYGLLTILSLDL